jgi:pyruvate/2-oxoacid:ferredoxin oxidoreductase alpha subunit
MNKITKAIKAFSNLTEEEKVEVAEYFDKEEEVVEEKPEKKIEEKIEEKEEPEKKVEPTSVEKMIIAMGEQIKTLSEKVEKSSPFGAKKKQAKGKDSTEFDDMFVQFRSKQRS